MYDDYWREKCEELQAEVDRCRWQPIETIPKDEPVLWLTNGRIIRLGWWVDGEEHEAHGTVGGGFIDKSMAEAGGVRGLPFAPTHWMHVPKLPRGEDSNGMTMEEYLRARNERHTEYAKSIGEMAR